MGEGGLFGPADHQVIDDNSKTALSSTSKLGDFYFLSIRHILAEISAKSIYQGDCCSCFCNETSQKIEHVNFFVLLENHGNAEGVYNFVPEKMFSGIKRDFFRVLLDSRG